MNTVFQDYALFPHMTVAENVAYGLKVKGVARAERTQPGRRGARRRCASTSYGGRKPVQLSGGQRQRVALARSIVNRPKVLLLDEPLGALDLKLRQEMQVFLKALQRELGMTFLYVTHDQEEALTMSDHVAVFNEGRIEQIGTPTEIYEHPTTEFVAGFVGTSNILERNGTPLLGPARAHRAAHRRSGEPATIADVVFVGAFTRYLVDTDAGERLTVVRQNDGSRSSRARASTLGWRAEDAYEIATPRQTTSRRSDEEGNVVGARRPRGRCSPFRRPASSKATRRNAEHDRVGGLPAAAVGEAVREARPAARSTRSTPARPTRW